MGITKQVLALLAWLIIEIPTTLFVVFVMVKVFLEQMGRKRKPAGQVRSERRLA